MNGVKNKEGVETLEQPYKDSAVWKSVADDIKLLIFLKC